MRRMIMAIATPLSVSGRWITDVNGNRVKLAGVNWAGAHQDAMTPGGLDYRQRDDIASQIAEWGFNSVRFPFALQTVTWGSPVASAGVAANPDLVGCTPWQVYTACVQALTAAGLMVIPNCHLLFRGWCCSGDDGNQDTDFCQLYTSTATSIQAVDSDALFFCEGLSYAADLTGTKTTPVTPGQGNCVVYSMHDYAWYHSSGQSQAEYITAMNNAGGFLMTEGTAPVWIGEFGTGNDSLAAVGASSVIGASSPSDGNLGAWFNNFLAWAGQTDVDWCWWLLDGTMCQGTTPQTNQLQFALGDRSGYGLFAQDWTGVSNPALLEALQAIKRPVTGPGV